MARSATADAGTETEGSTDGTTGEAPKAKRNRPDRSYVVVPLPADLKARFEEEAKTADVPVGPYVRNLLARFLGIEIPVTTTARRSKYATDEERKNAQKARNQNRSSTMRDLMAAFRKAQASGKSPEEAAAEASAAILDLIKNGPAPAAPEAPVEGEAIPA